tara:strand:+ start:1751 stop:2059 length:309 start_codon:yes stop_codon:yes gene_type:complete
MRKETIYILILTFLISSCGDTLNSVKRGLTGAKADSSDEFLIEKKDPLILPPDFEDLPTPDEKSEAAEEFSIIEKNLETLIEDDASPSSSIEESIIRKIQKK